MTRPQGSQRPRRVGHCLLVVQVAAALAALCACAAPVAAPTVDPQALDRERTRLATIALASWEVEEQRVYAVSRRLLSTALERGTCAPARPDRGLLLESIADLPEGLAAEVKKSNLRARGMAVIAVEPDGPAARAGVRVGDAVREVNGSASTSADALPAAWKSGESIVLGIESADGERQVTLGARPNCDVRVVMDDTHDIVASTDSAGTIHVAQGIVQALQDDDSLAFVIAHELGHRAHDDSAVVRLLASARSRDQERQADLFGIQLARAAGFDVQRIADVWDRLAQLDPDRVGQNWLEDHPLRAERSLRLREAIATVK